LEFDFGEIFFESIEHSDCWVGDLSGSEDGISYVEESVFNSEVICVAWLDDFVWIFYAIDGVCFSVVSAVGEGVIDGGETDGDTWSSFGSIIW